MKGFAGFVVVAGWAAALFGAAEAQPNGDTRRAVLFDQPNFQGRWVTVVAGSPDLGRWGFSARAMSARFEGDWTVCDAPDLDGRCATVKGDVADLTQIGLTRVVSLGEALPSDARPDDRAAADEGPQSYQAPADDDEQIRVGARSRPIDDPPPAAPSMATAQPADPPPPAASASSDPPPVVAAVAPATPTDPPALGAPKSSAAPQQFASAEPPAAGPVGAGLQAAATSATSAAKALAGDAGQSAVFFAKPMKGGAEVAVDLQGPANEFCRAQGLGSAVYFDTDGKVLRDVLCRR